MPNSREKRVDYAVEIPKASSLILKHDLNAPLDGLDMIPDAAEPPVGIVFWAFRIMVGLGFAMLGLGLWSLIARWRKGLYEWTWLHRAAVLLGPSGFIAVLAGWVVTEVGRQPFTIYGLLRTTESASPLDAPAVAGSLLAFVLVYFAVFGMAIWYLLRLMQKPPEAHVAPPSDAPIRSAGLTPALEVIERDGVPGNANCHLPLLSQPNAQKDAQPFFWALALFGLCLVGLGISIWPNVIPARVSIWEAAALYRSQLLMLVGAGVLVPVILGNTIWAYWVFRGKVGHEGYH